MERMQVDEGSMASGGNVQADLSLAFALAARLCHDLAGTLGALTGTLELAVEGRDPEALDLALACAREVSARLRLLRAAWSANPEPPDLPRLVAGLPGTDRLSVDLSGVSAKLGEAPGRLAANLLLLAAGSLPRGGTISLAGDDEAMVLEIAGPNAGWPPALASCLADQAALQAACANTREIGLAITCLLARQLNRVITRHSPSRLTTSPV